MKLVACRISLALRAGVASGQQFEVASVKVSEPDSIRGLDGGPGSKDPTRYIFLRVRLKSLLMMAWQMEDFQLSGKFDLERDEFDLATKLPSGTIKEEFAVMLRNLLAERFHLRTHLGRSEFPVLTLEVAKSGPKLRESAGKSEPIPPAWLDRGFPGFPAIRCRFEPRASKRRCRHCEPCCEGPPGSQR
jgi:uncharacterized protein (TIGR03435 family)